jgi:hypothetical protein
MSNPDPKKEAKARADKRGAKQDRQRAHAPKRAKARLQRGSDPDKVSKEDIRHGLNLL